MPKFSVVIPAYNREREISRALNSCFTQSFTDFEIIVVDDGSADNTARVVADLGHPKLKLIRHESNRGGNAARNTGALAASGEWVIILDSDDELLAAALEKMAAITAETPSEIDRIAFMYRRDDGGLSPWPPLRNEVVDYPAFLAWLQGRQFYDFLSCTRRETFDHVRYPERRWSDQSLYQMDFAQRYRTQFREEVLACVHTDSGNRLSHTRRNRWHARANAAELGHEMDILLRRHGDALRRFAPRTWQMFRRMRASYHFLAGSRTGGFRLMLSCLRETPFLPEAWALLFLGTLPTQAVATVRSWRGPAT